MKLVLIALIQIIICVHCGVMKHFIDAFTNEIHKVKEDTHYFKPHHHHNNGNWENEGKENYHNNAKSSYSKSVESVNESGNDRFSSKEQKESNEAYARSIHDEPNWARHSFHANNKPVTQGNTYNNENEYYNDREYVSQDNNHSQFTNEYTSNSNPDTSKKNEDSWNNDKGQSNFESTSGHYKPNYENTIVNQREDNSKPNSGPNNGILTTNNDSTTSIDQIVFPGKVNSSTAKNCPEGLVIAANGDCLEPIVIHMGNTTTNYAKSTGVPRSFFVGGCLQGYSKTIDGDCVEIIYD